LLVRNEFSAKDTSRYYYSTGDYRPLGNASHLSTLTELRMLALAPDNSHRRQSYFGGETDRAVDFRGVILEKRIDVSGMKQLEYVDLRLIDMFKVSPPTLSAADMLLGLLDACPNLKSLEGLHHKFYTPMDDALRDAFTGLYWGIPKVQKLLMNCHEFWSSLVYTRNSDAELMKHLTSPLFELDMMFPPRGDSTVILHPHLADYPARIAIMDMLVNILPAMKPTPEKALEWSAKLLYAAPTWLQALLQVKWFAESLSRVTSLPGGVPTMVYILSHAGLIDVSGLYFLSLCLFPWLWSDSKFVLEQMPNELLRLESMYLLLTKASRRYHTLWLGTLPCSCRFCHM
jgi:hypothetical protein